MSNDDDLDYVKKDGKFYCRFEDDFWVWDTQEQVWLALDPVPNFLTLVGERAALVSDTGQHYCNCDLLTVLNRGCLCGGL